MNTVVSSTASAARPGSASLDQILGAVKQAHALAGCRTCGLMSTFAEPARPSAATR
jgi:hypothetical protein